ncbi:hypothetical protein [Arthrobacter sp. D3-16]
MNKVRNITVGVAMAVALAGGGVYLAMAVPDGASTSAAVSSTDRKGPHHANGITEELLTGDTAARVEAAAKAAHPGATVFRVETDADGAVYEAHIRKVDGTHVTLKFDASFNITGTEEGKRR